MGRVARYKKIKACDPFSKRSKKLRSGLDPSSGVLLDPRKRTGGKADRKRKKKLRRLEGNLDNIDKIDDGYDIPTKEEDDFDLSDPLLSVKKQKVDSLEKELLEDTSIPQTEEEERKVARILKTDARHLLDGASNRLKKKGIVEERKQGESMNAYDKRVKRETRVLLKDVQDEVNASSTKHGKKKEFLKHKKQKKKKGKATIRDDLEERTNSRYESVDDEPLEVTPETAKKSTMQMPLFGEQAERPPTFHLLPRGAKAKKKQDSSSGTMDDEKRQAEQRAMEIMRNKVQARYNLIKKKRKKAGDFHL